MEVASLSLFTDAISTAYIKMIVVFLEGGKQRRRIRVSLTLK